MGLAQSSSSHETEKKRRILKTVRPINSNKIDIQKSHFGRDPLKTRRDNEFSEIFSQFQLKAIPDSQEELIDLEAAFPETKNPTFEYLLAHLKSDSKTLPLNLSNCILVFCHQVNPLQFKAFISGAGSTPYAHGLFEFDISFQESLEHPPKVKFQTTGAHKVSFGPRLSSSGKVKLPILGTSHSSDKEDFWNSDKKLSEILYQLQGLVKTNNICEGDLELKSLNEDEESRRKLNKACGNIVKYCNLQFAMLEYLNHPKPWMTEFIHIYFYLKKDIILSETQKWLIAAENDDGHYEGLASMYNLKYSTELKGKYLEKLTALTEQLQTKLEGIKISPDFQLVQKSNTNLRKHSKKTNNSKPKES